MKAYTIDARAVWTGEEIEFDPSRGRPPTAIVEQPPEFDAKKSFATWSGNEWLVRPLSDIPTPVEPDPEPGDPYAHFMPIPLLRQRLEKLGLFDDFSAYLAQFPTLMFKVLSLERGVDPAYPDLITAFDAMTVPQSIRDYLMADPAMGVPDIPTE